MNTRELILYAEKETEKILDELQDEIVKIFITKLIKHIAERIYNNGNNKNNNNQHTGN